MESSTETTNKRYCQLCSKRLWGRSDKKFCNSDCRSSFHNQTNSESNIPIRKINKILKRNHRILSGCLGLKPAIVDKDLLRMKQFDFNYFTAQQVNANGHIIYFCYNIAYEKSSENSFRIVDFTDTKQLLINW